MGPFVDDRALAARCVAGDARAWEALAARHGPDLAHHVACALARLLGRADPDECDEIVQETFAHLAEGNAKALRDFQWRCSLATYMKAVASSLCVRRTEKTRLERRLRKHSPEIGPVLETRADEAPSPLERLVTDEEARALEEALAGLSGLERLALRLHYWEGASPAEIGRLFGISHANACMLLARSIKKTKKKLRNFG